jgi:hypothetical protein
MNRIVIAVILVLTLWAMLMVSGCVTLETKINEYRMNMVAPWADDKPIVLDTWICEPQCFYLGPLPYDEMLIALGEV